MLGAGDRVLYSVMPLYHSSGSQIGTAVSLAFGNKTVIKAKFSARNFFQDCAKYKATVSEITNATALDIFLYYSMWHLSGRKFHWRDLPLSSGHSAVTD